MLLLSMRMDVFNGEEVVDRCSTSKPIFKATLGYDLTDSIQAYAEQQRGQSIALEYATFDVQL